jgi:hypothetical protein
MNANPATSGPARSTDSSGVSSASHLFQFSNLRFAILALLVCLVPASLPAQVSVLTERNDISRSGVNSSETVLTPANVNTTQFGLLFSYAVDGYVYAQPLYMPNVTINGQTHNVVFVATEHDSVFAFDADSSAGSNALPLWQVTLLDAAHGAAPGASTVPNEDTDSGDLTPEIGITSTPVIDPTTGTIYVEGKTNENGGYVQRLHALDITTGAEKFSGPAVLSASVPGTGNGSSGGVLNFDPLWHLQRAGLLLLNGIVYLGFGSHGDMGPWHGWILAYNAATLQQTSAFCFTANGTGAGVWLAGTGLSADVTDPVKHPYGRLLVATGNGSFNATTPYTTSMSYGDSLVAFDLTNGILTVTDTFTPFNQETLSEDDLDLASAGTLILPDQTTGPTHVLIQASKQGTLYVVNRDNLGGNNATTDNVIQEVTGQNNGLWSTPTYFNGAIYLWGTNDDMKAFTFINGVLESSHFTSSDESASYPGPMTSASSNGTANGIIWVIQADQSPEILRAYDPTDLNNLLYSSNQNADRDTPGDAVKFVIPTVANGKVYVPSQSLLSVYGLLAGNGPVATPAISPSSEFFAPSVEVTLTDSTPESSIFYTTDGSTPTSASTQYSGPFTLTATTTVNAIATAISYSPSATASATYTLETPAATPTFSPAPGTYATPQHVTLADTTSGASVFYTTDGTTPTTSSTKYTGAITVSSTATIDAIATANDFLTSAVASGTYTIETPAATPTFSPAPGTYSSAQQVTISDSTSGASIFYTTNGTTPTTSSTPYTGAIAVGATLTIKAIATAPGSLTSAVASGLYTLDIPAATPAFSPAPGIYAAAQKVTITDSTTGAAIYYTTNGSTPTTSSTKYTAEITVSATTTIKAIATAAGFVTSAVASGTYTIETPAATPVFSPAAGTYAPGQQVTISDSTEGATIFYTTNGTTPTTSSAQYTGAINVNATTTIKAIAAATGSLDSAVATSTYTIETPAATPVFSPVAGTYPSAQHVTITDGTTGATIYYTTNGSVPTTSSTKYTAAITVSATTTINAIAVATGSLTSAMATATFTIETPAATPTFSPVGGTYTSAQDVTISDATTGAAIFYTTDGATPTTSSTPYTVAIPVSKTLTIKAIASAPESLDSAVASAIYRIEAGAAAPTFSPAAGTYSTAQQVTISDSAFDAVIYFTTDGSTPTASSTKYTAPITVGSTTTIKAVAKAGLGALGAVGEATYTIETVPTAATPTFSPAAGSFTTTEQVTISDATSGAAIFYTTDGTTPTVASTPYTGAITVSATTTVKAIATATSMANSNVASAIYTLRKLAVF